MVNCNVCIHKVICKCSDKAKELKKDLEDLQIKHNLLYNDSIFNIAFYCSHNEETSVHDR
jgi:hypothetical protein